MLDLLANRISSGQAEGDIQVNGRPRGSTFKHYAAYVQQGKSRLFGVWNHHNMILLNSFKT